MGCDIITSGNIMTLNYFENSVKPWTGFEPVTSTSMGLTSYIDRNLTKVTLYQALLVLDSLVLTPCQVALVMTTCVASSIMTTSTAVTM